MRLVSRAAKQSRTWKVLLMEPTPRSREHARKLSSITVRARLPEEAKTMVTRELLATGRRVRSISVDAGNSDTLIVYLSPLVAASAGPRRR